jgi:alkylation response protein AidB-like acyl-CoA dehydrogenase
MLQTKGSILTDSGGSSFLSESQQGWLKKACAFADSIPLSECIASDVENKFRKDLFEKACKEGFGALPFPKEYGGSGSDYVSFVLVNEEFARRCVPIMSSLGVHVLCQEPIYRFGSEEQKRKYLPPSASGQYLAAFGLTEPGAGSDTAALAASARLSGDEYILNGTKTFITSGASADYYIVMARLAADQGAAAGASASASKAGGGAGAGAISAFIVERNFPGFEIGQKFDMLGMRGYSTCEIVFNDCRVPRQNMLGEPGWGRKVALGSLAKGRVTIAAQATGWARGAVEELAKHLSGAAPEQAQSPAHQSAMSKLSELATEVEAARMLTYQAACAIDRGESDAVLAGMAKVSATDIAMKASTVSISLMGLEGLNPQRLVERIFRDAKAGQIYEGTNQIQRLLIARHLTRKP